jgi:hypothetical protein
LSFSSTVALVDVDALAVVVHLELVFVVRNPDLLLVTQICKQDIDYAKQN